MAAYLQWRRFVFFDRETVKEPSGPDGAGSKPFALPPGIAVCDSGRGSLVFGDILCGARRCGLRGVRPSRGRVRRRVVGAVWRGLEGTPALGMRQLPVLGCALFKKKKPKTQTAAGCVGAPGLLCQESAKSMQILV